MVGNDLGKLFLDVLRLLWLVANAGQDLSSLFRLPLDNEVPWGFWKEEKTSAKDESGDELDGGWDSVGSAVYAVFGAVVGTRWNQQAEGNSKLVASNQSTANFAGGNLGHVENDDSGDEANTW